MLQHPWTRNTVSYRPALGQDCQGLRVLKIQPYRSHEQGSEPSPPHQILQTVSGSTDQPNPRQTKKESSPFPKQSVIRTDTSEATGLPGFSPEAISQITRESSLLPWYQSCSALYSVIKYCWATWQVRNWIHLYSKVFGGLLWPWISHTLLPL